MLIKLIGDFCVFPSAELMLNLHVPSSAFGLLLGEGRTDRVSFTSAKRLKRLISVRFASTVNHCGREASTLSNVLLWFKKFCNCNLALFFG